MIGYIPFIVLFLVHSCKCQSEAVYVVNMESQLEVCPDDVSAGYVDTSKVIVERFNETIAYMHGDIEFCKDLDADTMVEVVLMKEASGKYELVFSHEICDLCGEIAKGADSDYHGYMKYFGIPDECPFPAGLYPIKEFVVDTSDLPVNSNTCGRYEAFLNLYKNPEKDCKTTKELLFCLNMQLMVERE